MNQDYIELERQDNEEFFLREIYPQYIYTLETKLTNPHYIDSNYDLAIELIYKEGYNRRTLNKIQSLACNEAQYGDLDIAMLIENLIESER